MKPEEVLARTYLFRGLPPARLAWIADRMRVRHYPRGSFLCRAGDPALEVYVLARGRVKGVSFGPAGEEVVDLVASEPGEVFGEPAALIEGAGRTVDGLVLESTTCYLITRDDLLRIVEEDHLVMRRLITRLSELARQRAWSVADMAFLDVTQRLAAKVLELARERGTPGPQGVQLRGRLTQAELGSMVAASRESVNRSLARLRAEGILAGHGGAIVVPDLDRLERRARQSAASSARRV